MVAATNPLRRSALAYRVVEEIAELDNIMIAVQGVTRHPTSEKYRV